MFEKRRIRRAIRRSKYKIELLEKKRCRSQAALIEAISTQTSPDDADVEYFNKYTGLIEQERQTLQDLLLRLKKA